MAFLTCGIGSKVAWWPRATTGPPVCLAAARVEEVPDCGVELVGGFDVAEVTGVGQDDEPGVGES
jgi:hypothetical protein